MGTCISKEPLSVTTQKSQSNISANPNNHHNNGNNGTTINTIASSPVLNNGGRPSALSIPSPPGHIHTPTPVYTYEQQQQQQQISEQQQPQLQQQQKNSNSSAQNGGGTQKTYEILAKTINFYLQRIEIISKLLQIIPTMDTVDSVEVLNLQREINDLRMYNQNERRELKHYKEVKARSQRLPASPLTLALTASSSSFSSSASSLMMNDADPTRADLLFLPVEEKEQALSSTMTPQQQELMVSINDNQIRFLTEKIKYVGELILRCQESTDDSRCDSLYDTLNHMNSLLSNLTKQQNQTTRTQTSAPQNSNSGSISNNVNAPLSSTVVATTSSPKSPSSSKNLSSKHSHTAAITNQLSLCKKLLYVYRESEMTIQEMIRSAEEVNDKESIANLLVQLKNVQALIHSTTAQKEFLSKSMGPKPELPRRVSMEYKGNNEPSTIQDVSRTNNDNGFTPALSASNSFSLLNPLYQSANANANAPSGEWVPNTFQQSQLVHSSSKAFEREEKYDTNIHASVLPLRHHQLDSSRVSLSTTKPIHIESSSSVAVVDARSPPPLPPRKSVENSVSGINYNELSSLQERSVTMA